MSNNSDIVAQGIWLLLVFVLVASALLSRRLPAMRLIAWAAGWAFLFLGAYIVFRLIEPDIIAWQQARRGGEIRTITSNSGSSAQSSAMTAELNIPMSGDGHFWVDGQIAGQKVRFLIDSGASVTALSASTARLLDLPQDRLRGQVAVQTANGTIMAQRSVIDLMTIGPIEAQNLPVLVSPALGDVNVLGMNFLTKLQSWRVSNGTMVLTGN